MANVTIRLETDRATRRRTIVVSYQSDADALPNEHEEEHRALVEKLVAGGLIAAEDAGLVRVEREQGASGAIAEDAPQGAQRKAVDQER